MLTKRKQLPLGKRKTLRFIEALVTKKSSLIRGSVSKNMI
jgi:hypothetical protein